MTTVESTMNINIVSESFDIKNVENNKSIYLSDEKDDLKMYCYTSCDESSSDLVKECRGVVVNGEGKIVVKTFGFTPEVSDLEVAKELLGDMKNTIVYDSEEGCLLRVYQYNGKWFISTHKKLDAFSSHWSSSVSFGMSFLMSLVNEHSTNESFAKQVGDVKSDDDLFTAFCKILDKERCHTFLVRNNKSNRIVCQAPSKPTLFYTGSFNRDGSGYSFDNISVSTPTLKEFKSSDEVLDYVKQIDPTLLQGVIVFKDNKPFKILNSQYNQLFKVRGNESSIKFRYLQLRNNPSKVELLKTLYPESIPVFVDYEDILLKVAKNIHLAYIKRFVKKEHTVVSKEEYGVVRECHGWHIQDRNNKVTLTKVLEVLNSQKPTILNRIIKRVKNEGKTPYNTPFNPVSTCPSGPAGPTTLHVEQLSLP